MRRSLFLALALLCWGADDKSTRAARGAEQQDVVKKSGEGKEIIAKPRWLAWEGHWKFSKAGNELLGYPGTLIRGESHGGMPLGFEVTFHKTIAEGLPEDALAIYRKEVFDRAKLTVVATGKWVSLFDKDERSETFCFVCERDGETYVYFAVPYAVVIGGTVSRLEGATPSKDLLAIDFGAYPWHKGRKENVPLTYVYERDERQKDPAK